MNINNYSFLDAAVTRVSAKKNQMGALANLVGRANAEDPMEMRIIDVVLDLYSQRVAHLDAVENGETDVPPKPVAAPELGVSSFLQELMNRSCWIARTLKNRMQIEDWQNGLDPTTQICEEIGFTLNDVNDIEAILQDDLLSLMTVQSELLVAGADTEAGNLPYFEYMEVESLVLYELRKPTEEIDPKTGKAIWKRFEVADSFDDALAIISEISTANRQVQIESSRDKIRARLEAQRAKVAS
tara:strand:- start:211 stop:936 length:726 start_codon:yes stop_codon:yes gene_type:complete